MKKYHQYTTEDFLNDADFNTWLKSGFINNVSLSALKDDVQHNNELNAAIVIATSLSQDKFQYPENRKKLLFDKITASIETAEQVQNKDHKKNIPSFVKYLIPLAIAASYFIIFFVNKKPDYTGEKIIVVDKTKEIIEKLPDGSTVTIDGGSNIKIAENFNKKRILNLEGRAFFQVKKGSSFKVITKNGTVEVLGTSFSILSRGNTFEVICKTGKVKVSSVTDAQPQILTPNEKVVIQNNVLYKSEASESAFDWKNGNYYFTEVALAQVVKELEIQFNLTIKMDNSLNDIKYTGFFNTSDLDKALYSVTWPLNLKYEKLTDKLVEIKN